MFGTYKSLSNIHCIREISVQDIEVQLYLSWNMYATIEELTCSFKNSEPSFQVFADRQRAQSIMPPPSISDSHGTWQVINIVLWIKHCLLYIHVHVLTKEIRVVYESLANVNKRSRRINELVTSEGFVDSAHIPHTD